MLCTNHEPAKVTGISSRMAETSRARAGFHILLAAIALNVAVAAIYPSVSLAGDPNNFSANEGNDNFGHLSQADVCGIEAIACGPTAAVNGFVYLQNRFPRIYGTKLTPTDSTSEVATALALASPSYMDTHGSGTLINDFILGKEQYISDATKGDIGAATIVDAQVSPVFPGNETAGLPAGDMAEPTGAFLANQLIDKEATEILIFPVNNNDVQSGPGHYLTVVDLHWTDTNVNRKIDQGEMATLGFVDPNGGAFKDDRSIFDANGHLILLGPQGARFRIEAIVSESPVREFVPEPSSSALLLPALVPLVWLVRARPQHRQQDG